MVAVIFKYSDNSEKTIDIAPGTSVMEGAVRDGVRGIDADCGGALACATCHVYIAKEWVSKLSPPSEQEIGLLEFVVNPEKESRLSCQIKVDATLDGLTVHIPTTQR